MMLHIPLLRKGEPYRSLDVVRLAHHRTREPFVEISQANTGLIRRDLMGQGAARDVLAGYTCSELLEVCARAAGHFAAGELPLGESVQGPEDYVQQVSATTGLPFALVTRNMSKISGVLAEMEQVLKGLTRGLDLSILDRGFGESNGQALSYYVRTDALGVVLPSNSPGVHGLWTPAVALKIPLVLKPGSAEPWTPYRIIQALIRAGAPPAAFGYYPTDHNGAGDILRHTGRAMVFGDASSTALWREDPRIEIHGPGYSKIVIGPDSIGDWEKYLDVMVDSIADNGGRSCVNASGIWVTDHAEELAEALAERVSKIVPLDAEDERAQLAPFAEPCVAARINAAIDDALREPGAIDVTARYNKGERLTTRNGCSYLLPTVILCDEPSHPLANREFLFPFASVVKIVEEEIPEALGPSLVVTAMTSDSRLIRRLLSSSNVGCLNIGPIQTNQVNWNQPHEGNLFEHLYARRAFRRASGMTA